MLSARLRHTSRGVIQWSEALILRRHRLEVVWLVVNVARVHLERIWSLIHRQGDYARLFIR